MRILFITAEYPPDLSGVGDYVAQWAQGLRRYAAKIVVLTSKKNQPNQSDEGIEILRQTDKWDFKAWPEIKNAIKVWNPEIIHLQYITHAYGSHPFINFLPFLIKLNFPKIKIATTLHEFAAPWKRLALLPLLLFSDVLIVTNDHHLKILNKLSRFLLFGKTCHRIPLAANILPLAGAKENREKIREQLGVHSGERLLVRFGIIHDISLPLILKMVSVFNKVQSRGLHAKLLLIGKVEPQAREKLMTQLAQHPAADFVILKADLSSELISAYLSAADIGLGLYPDGMSEKRTALLSLLAHGLPVIGTKSDERWPSEFHHLENIFGIPVNASEEQWASAIMNLHQNDELREKIARGALELTTRHQWPDIARSAWALYQGKETLS